MGTEEEQHVVMKKMRADIELERRVRITVRIVSVLLVVWALGAVIKFAWSAAVTLAII